MLVRKFILLLLLITTNALANVIPRYNTQNYDYTIKQIYKTLPANYNIKGKVKFISGYFLGKPYLLGALGEGPVAIFDKSPLYRTDAFDCLTYVATVLALAESNNLAEFQKNIKRINYSQGQVKFLYRNHFTSTDWNPQNQANGYLRDITKKITDRNHHSIVKIARAYINKPNWFRNLPVSCIKQFVPLSAIKMQQLLFQLHSLGGLTKLVKSEIYYLPLNKLFNSQNKANMYLFNQIPSGSIIEIIRPNWNLRGKIGTNLQVSHLGFAVRTKQGLMFREASSLENKVIDISLIDYLKDYLKSSTVKGINVQQILFPDTKFRKNATQ